MPEEADSTADEPTSPSREGEEAGGEPGSPLSQVTFSAVPSREKINPKELQTIFNRLQLVVEDNERYETAQATWVVERQHLKDSLQRVSDASHLNRQEADQNHSQLVDCQNREEELKVRLEMEKVNMKAENIRLEGLLQGEKSASESKTQMLSDARAEIANLKSRLTDREVELEKTGKRVESLRKECNDLQGSYLTAKQLEEELTKQRDANEATIKSLREEHEQLQDEVADFRQVRAEFEEAKKDLREAREKIESLDSSLATSQISLKETRLRLVDEQHQSAELQSVVKDQATHLFPKTSDFQLLKSSDQQEELDRCSRVMKALEHVRLCPQCLKRPREAMLFPCKHEALCTDRACIDAVESCDVCGTKVGSVKANGKRHLRF